jgi:N-carbamoyl-L-amino-acid hydrolase
LDLRIDIKKLSDEIDALALISDAASPAVTRILFTGTDLRGRSFVKQLAQEAGLQIREDAMGNIFMTWRGTDSQLKPVATGSHTDAIPFSGKYDGVVGVLGAIEAVRALKRLGHQPARTIDLIMFTSEEPTRFGIGCLGSRVLSGSMGSDQLINLSDAQGATFDHIRQEAGFNGSLNSVTLNQGHYAAFIELHIEQGPRLERMGIDIGIVTDIAAPATVRIIVNGEGGHAGAVLMPVRKDALIAAAKIAVAVQEIAVKSPGEYAVATTGKLEVFPGAVNSIPSQVTMEIDVRDIDLVNRDAMITDIMRTAKYITGNCQVTHEYQILNSDAPASCDGNVLDLIEGCCDKLSVSHQTMISHAYHDALFMSQLCPTAMIFVPSEHGFSHRPEEFTSPQQIEKGVQVLAQVLARLSAE